MNEQERIERAYRLAQWPLIVAGTDADREMAMVWAEAVDKLHHPERHTSNKRLIHDLAILALALLPEGGGVLGRWRAYTDSGERVPGRFLLDDDTYSYRDWHSGLWHLDLAPGAYLDGTAQELLLLMCAADELSRREVQP